MSKRLITSLFIAALLLSSCSIVRTFHGDISQGNVITHHQVLQLHDGMTQKQVEALLGKPVLAQPFNRHDLIYVYRYQPGYGKATQKTLTLHFNSRQKLTSHHFSQSQ